MNLVATLDNPRTNATPPKTVLTLDNSDGGGGVTQPAIYTQQQAPTKPVVLVQQTQLPVKNPVPVIPIKGNTLGQVLDGVKGGTKPVAQQIEEGGTKPVAQQIEEGGTKPATQPVKPCTDCNKKATDKMGWAKSHLVAILLLILLIIFLIRVFK